MVDEAVDRGDGHGRVGEMVGVVGTPGGGDRAKPEDQPHAKQIAHAPQPAMPSTIEAEWEKVPSARG